MSPWRPLIRRHQPHPARGVLTAKLWAVSSGGNGGSHPNRATSLGICFTLETSLHVSRQKTDASVPWAAGPWECSVQQQRPGGRRPVQVS